MYVFVQACRPVWLKREAMQEYFEVSRGSECRWKVHPLQPGEQYSFIVKVKPHMALGLPSLPLS